MWHMISLYETKACVSIILCPTMHETTTKSSLIFYLRQQLSTFFSRGKSKGAFPSFPKEVIST
jgi:hypothetical protein